MSTAHTHYWRGLALVIDFNKIQYILIYYIFIDVLALIFTLGKDFDKTNVTTRSLK